MESVYSYIANVYPNESVSLLTGKYGYQIQSDFTTDEIAAALQDVVNNDGEAALYDVMDLHPDKHIILELFATPQGANGNNFATNCVSCSPSPSTVPPMPVGHSDMMNHGDKAFFSSPTNVMIVAVAVFAGIALLKS